MVYYYYCLNTAQAPKRIIESNMVHDDFKNYQLCTVLDRYTYGSMMIINNPLSVLDIVTYELHVSKPVF